MSTSDLKPEFVWVHVHTPTIHNYKGGKYATYDIELKTNSLSFSKKHSIVQRSYSEFQWLRKALIKTTARTPPSLPSERIFRRFSLEYLKRNEEILTDFMQQVVKNTFFVSSTPLHLFLQTELHKEEMDKLSLELKRRGSMNSLARAIALCESQQRSSEKLETSSKRSDRLLLRSSSEASVSEDTISHSGSTSSLEMLKPHGDAEFVDFFNNNFDHSTDLDGIFVPEKSNFSTQVSYEVNDDYPKWLIDSSSSHSSLSSSETSENLEKTENQSLTGCYTEVSWCFEALQKT